MSGRLCLALALALVCVGGRGVAAQHIDGWVTEPGIEPPSYAVTEPVASNVNIDTVVLVCGDSDTGRGVELDLYLSGSGPLLPENADLSQLKEAPSVELVVDDRVFPARLLFSEDFVVVTDAGKRDPPVLSQRLLDALQHGATLVLRFDLLRDTANRPNQEGDSVHDGFAVVDLVRGHGAIAAVRRCAAGSPYQAAR